MNVRAVLKVCSTGLGNNRTGKGEVHPRTGLEGLLTSALDGGWAVNVTPQPLFTPGKDRVPIVQKAGWALGPVWMGAENPAPTRI